MITTTTTPSLTLHSDEMWRTVAVPSMTEAMKILDDWADQVEPGGLTFFDVRVQTGEVDFSCRDLRLYSHLDWDELEDGPWDLRSWLLGRVTWAMADKAMIAVIKSFP